MNYNISIKERNGKFKHHKVPKEVYIYIKQLELAVRFPKHSKIKKLYPKRLGRNESHEDFIGKNIKIKKENNHEQKSDL